MSGKNGQQAKDPQAEGSQSQVPTPQLFQYSASAF